jgi:hypothetical protein
MQFLLEKDCKKNSIAAGSQPMTYVPITTHHASAK